MNPRFETFRSRVVPLLRDEVDTDQIVPARFLRITDKAGLADALFHDWRREPDFVLNRPEHRGAQVLLSGENFGCGSSREHAPWALIGAGFRAVIARSFGDIFRINSLKNGLLPIAVDATVHARLAGALEREAGAEVEIDLFGRRLGLPDGSSVGFAVDAFSRECLLAGIDELGYLLGLESAIAAYERRHDAR
jgi:3-isopropylmalate/(R)-2-methylmalate dehydratase small subunit